MATDQDIRVRLSLLADDYNRGIKQADDATTRLESSLRRLQQTSGGTSGATDRLAATANRVKFGLDTAGKAASRTADEVRKTGKAADDASHRFERLEKAFGRLKGGLVGLGLGMAVQQIARFTMAAAQAASNMQGLEIQIAAVVAANGKIADSNGRVLQGIEKINAARQISSDVFAKLQADAMNTTATTEELIDLYATALPSALGAGLDLDQTRKVVVSMSNAMKVLRIDSQQAKSEMRALFSGEINQDSDLAKQLGIRKEDIALAKQKGQLEQFLLDKMKEYNAAAAIQAGTLEGLSSSIQDMGEKWMRIVGQRPMEVLTEGARFLLRELMGTEGATTSLHRVMAVWAADTSQGLSQLVSGVVWLGKQLIWVMGLINRADYHLQSWAVNVREKVVGGMLKTMEQSAKLGGLLPWNRQASQEAVKQLQAEQSALAKSVAAARQALNEREFGDPNKLMQRVGAPSRPMIGPGASGFRYTPNPVRPDAKEAEKQRREAERAAKKAEQEAEKRQRELEQQQDERVRAIQDQMQYRLRINDAYEGGLAGRIKIMEQYLAVLKKLPRAEEEALDLSRDLEVARIEQKVAGLKREREERERAAEAQKAAEAEQREYVMALAESERDAKLKLIDQELEDTTHANDRKREEFKRLYEEQKIGAADYYAQVGRLRNEDLAAEANASLRRIAEERKVLMARREQLTNPLEGPIKWADVAKVDADLSGLQAEQERVIAKYRQGVKEANEANAREYGEEMRKQTREGLEGAVDAVFSGDPLSAIANTFLSSAKKGIIDALADSDVGKGIASLLSGKVFGGGLVGGLAGLLLGGFASLVGSSFSDLRRIGEENKRIAADMAQTRAELSEDPLDDIRLKYQRQRDEIAERRSGALKIFGLTVPGTWRQGALTPDEEATLAAAEAKEIAEARRKEVAERMEALEAEIALGRKGHEEEIKHLEDILRTEQLTYNERLQHELKLQDVKRRGRDEERRWALEQQMAATQGRLADIDAKLGLGYISPEEMEQLRSQKRQLQAEEMAAREAAIAKLEEEMRIVDESSDRYKELWRERQDLLDENADTRRSWMVEGAERFQEAWQKAMDAAARAVEDMTQRAEKALNSLEQAGQDSIFQSKNYRDYAAARGWTSEFQNQIQSYMDEIELVRRLRAEFQKQDHEANRMLGSVNEYLNDLFYTGGRKVPYTTDFDWLAKEMQRNGGFFLRRDGSFAWPSGLANVKANYEASMAIRNQAPDKYREYDRREREAWAALDVMKAKGESLVADLLKDMQLELQQIRAGDDPEAKKAAERARIEAEFAKRRQDLYDQGLIDIYGKEDNTLVDQQLQNQLATKLEELKNAQLTAVDLMYDESRNRPTEANPLPVRVVELPPAFPLPASFYFRQAAQPVLRLEAGAIQINGSGLTDRQLTAAVEQAIVNAGTTLTRTVNRENLIGNAVVRVN
ncbi:hypothetical protein D3C72_600870 [compost metagenome]